VPTARAEQNSGDKATAQHPEVMHKKKKGGG